MFRRQKYPRYQQKNHATDKERFHFLTSAVVARDWDSRYNWYGNKDMQDNKSFLQHSKIDSPLGQAMQDCRLENFTIETIEECGTQEQAN